MYQSGGASVGLALVAGEAAWADPTEPATSIERMTAYIEILMLAALLSGLWVMAWSRTPAPGGVAAAAPIAGTSAVLALAIRPVRLLVNRRREANVWWSILWRCVSIGVLVAAFVANAPDWGALALWPLGTAIGAEATLCAWRVGIDVGAVQWYRGFLTSSLHLGFIGAAAAAVVGLGGDHGWRVGIGYLLVLQLMALAGCVTAGILEHVRQHQLAADAETVARITAEEHRRRAHWLHDDVSGQLRTMSLRVQSEAASPADVVTLIDELDHELRLRQLDELLISGTARLAEIIQPYVRNAQGHGLEIIGVPPFEDASLVADEATGRTVARGAAVFTTNAITAGATRIGYELRHSPSWIELCVTDDAGGFDIADVPAGRALWQLAHAPTTHFLRTDRTTDGTAVRFRFSSNGNLPTPRYEVRESPTPPTERVSG